MVAWKRLAINFRDWCLLPHFWPNELTSFFLSPHCTPHFVGLQVSTPNRNNPLTDQVTRSSMKSYPLFRTFRTNKEWKTNLSMSAASRSVQSSVVQSLSLNIRLLVSLYSNSRAYSLCKGSKPRGYCWENPGVYCSKKGFEQQSFEQNEKQHSQKDWFSILF